MLNIDTLSAAALDSVASLSNLLHLELGDCSSCPPDQLFQSLAALKSLRGLRLEGGHVGLRLGELRWAAALQKLELVDVHLREGFGDGLVRLQMLKKLLLIPFYKDEVRQTRIITVTVFDCFYVNIMHMFVVQLAQYLIG